MSSPVPGRCSRRLESCQARPAASTAASVADEETNPGEIAFARERCSLGRERLGHRDHAALGGRVNSLADGGRSYRCSLCGCVSGGSSEEGANDIGDPLG
jgi:hypothetical protein